MTLEQVNQTIDGILGRCRHIPDVPHGHSKPAAAGPKQCKKCNETWDYDYRERDYTLPWKDNPYYGPALEEMKGMEWWKRFLEEGYLETWADHDILEEDIESMAEFLDGLLTPSTGSRLIAEWWENRKEK